MKFEYTVKFNGRRYLPGEDVPMEPKTKVKEPKVEESTEDVALDDEPKSVLTEKKKGRKKPKS